MAIPEGITAYTLVIDGPNTWVWNAMKGEKYSVSDTFCPLVSIGCLINGKNVSLYRSAYNVLVTIGHRQHVLTTFCSVYRV